MDARRWSADVMELGDRIAALTAAGAAQLCRYLDEAYGVQSPVAATVNPEPGPDPEHSPAPPTVVGVRLEGYDPVSKVAVVRAVRAVTGRGLKEALELLGQAPFVLMEGLDRDEGERVKAELEAAGARVSLV
jgi:large subunit ribosomal protein L7/L12